MPLVEAKVFTSLAHGAAGWLGERRHDEVLAERMAQEPFPHQEALEVGMAGEDDAEEVVDFALLQVGSLPERRERGHFRMLTVVAADLDREEVVPFKRREMIDDLKVIEVVDRGEVVEVVDSELALEGATGVEEGPRVDGEAVGGFLFDGVGEVRPQ